MSDAVLGTSFDTIVGTDGDGTIRFWNPGADRIFGQTSGDTIGQSLDIIIPERLRQRHWAGYRQVMASGEIRYGRAAIYSLSPAKTARAFPWSSPLCRCETRTAARSPWRLSCRTSPPASRKCECSGRRPRRPPNSISRALHLRSIAPDASILHIGHSTRSIEDFVGLLREADAELVVDVRTIPRSRKNSQYNRDIFPTTLATFKLGYTHIAELGRLRSDIQGARKR